METNEKMQQSADRLAEVWKHATDGDDLFAAMAWVEAESLAWLLADAGHPAVAASVLRAWHRNDDEAGEHDDAYSLAVHAFEAAS